MRISYQQFDRDEALRRFSREQLLKLWNELLLQASGDVNQALEWLEFLWQRHNFFNGDYTFEDFRNELESRGMIQRGGDGEAAGPETPPFKLTKRGERMLRQDSLDQVFGRVRNLGSGDHRSSRSGAGGDKLAETRPFQPGDLSGDIDYQRSIHNAFLHRGIDEFTLQEDDLEVNEREHTASCATVMMIDISHSMILYGEDRITPAKRVAIALAELIKTKYPKDSLDIITFGNEAQPVAMADLPYLRVGPYHTNTKAGLQLAQRLLSRKRHTNKRIFMITDGKPSVIIERGEVYRNSFGLDPLIVNRTLEEAAACFRRNIEISTFMIAQDPVLVDFVDRLTRINKGRAYFSTLDDLGGYIFVDYVKNRRRRVH